MECWHIIPVLSHTLLFLNLIIHLSVVTRNGTGDNSSVFSSLPASEVDALGKKRFVGKDTCIITFFNKPTWLNSQWTGPGNHGCGAGTKGGKLILQLDGCWVNNPNNNPLLLGPWASPLTPQHALHPGALRCTAAWPCAPLNCVHVMYATLEKEQKTTVP